MLDLPRGLQKFQPSFGPEIVAGGPRPHGDTERLMNRGAEAEARTTELLHSRRGIYDDRGKLLKSISAEETTNGTDDAQPKIEELVRDPKEIIHCYSCGQDCKRAFYKRTGASALEGLPKEYNVCPTCFKEGRFSSRDTTGHFIKSGVEGYSRLDKDSAWTDLETLKLLEALQVEDDDWHKVAKHVQTRTPEECVQKFLQMEIEDKYIAQVDDEAATSNVLNYGRIPIDNSENPVMSVIGFLAGMTDPETTAAAANRSVDTMRAKLARSIEQELKPRKKANEIPDKSEDNMEVDVTTAPTDNDEGPVSDFATLTIATAAARSSALASHEERQMTTLVSSALNSELEKIELKLKQFTQIESLLHTERLEIEKQQQELFLDRLLFKRRVREVQDGLRRGTFNPQSLDGAGDKLAFETLLSGRAEEDGQALGAKRNEDEDNTMPGMDDLKVYNI